jgi:hypothetical protein
MIDSKRLLADLQKLLKVLEADIRERLEAQPERVAELDAEWRAARDARRTAATQFEWREERTTQAGVHWILGTVFLRFLEDNGYLERPFLFGPDAHRQSLATDRHARYFRDHPDHSDREYLLNCFTEAAQLPGLSGLFDPRHNPLYRLELTGDGAMALRDFWRRVDPDSGVVVHDFSDPSHGTRFLGDLYQDLSESARKRYALLQTPQFIEEFILDRTLDPAIQTFGYQAARLIDATAGSGHFLLGAFQRFLGRWQREEPARNLPDLAQRALDAVYGVDINPFAVEISRFRLLIAALHACGIGLLRNAPDFRINVVAGDSLLHGRRFGQLDLGGEAENLASRYSHAYATEDLEALNRILGQQYHAVVGNPPYITPKDSALNEIYRARYSACHMKYSLGVPFTQRFFELAVEGVGSSPAGFVGMITTNSFMKREFGRKLIEEYLPRVDLTHVIDTSGAYIPGHGTPTVILFGRDRAPVGDTVRTVMGIKGEPSTPRDPAQGQVWRAIVDQLDMAGSESEFVSVADAPRTTFGCHPWSIGGGGAAELKDQLEEGLDRLQSFASEIGITAVNGQDEIFLLADAAHARRLGIERIRGMVTGDLVRDWVAGSVPAVWLYTDRYELIDLTALPRTGRHFWLARSIVNKRRRFGTPMVERGLTWYEYQELYVSKLHAPLTITFGEVATHNHFVLERGGKVFKQTAPVIKLPAGASDDQHLGLLGLLNSSVACFWLKQVCHNKGSTVDERGARQRTAPFEDFYAFNSTKVATFPVAANAPADLSRAIDTLAQQRASDDPIGTQGTPVFSRAGLDAARERVRSIRTKMIALQEELDWRCYRLYGLTDQPLEYSDPPGLALGERAFEIVLARRVASGDEQSTWFERHGSTPITELPRHWPDDYRAMVERRIALIESDRNIGLIERPEYKRRWNDEPWEAQERRALGHWLLDRLESERYWPRTGDVPMRSTSRLADMARTDDDFMQAGALYAADEAFDVAKLVAELVESESVPHLPALRYTYDGLRKRAEWERTWDLQRQEDATGGRLDVPVPPKYKSSDFTAGHFWRLRGPLDVPKERFVSYPGASLDADGSPVVTWAGYDHLQQARALAGHILDLKENHGWGRERLIPLLAGLAELLPWLKQWYNEPDPTLGERMGDYFDGFVQDEARAMGVTVAEVQAWRPQAPVRGRRRRS